ncbi:uncharacterized protein LOC123310764 [Coccinella septempunctata]|uniref:uncharacterized protein LOC123310764 n=1 Tax=Coccinella septempunctata TaxID=41139 RepID=UPI001D07E055|nr:uncharacterized protein LOC123310764 [Coccinella septempunctata]
MDTNALISYLDSHNAEYEEWYRISKEKYLRIAKSLFGSLSNCNTTVLESCKFNSLLRVVRTFLDKSEIFEDWKSVKSLIDFILLNVGVKNDRGQKEITMQLLTLLVDILERTKPIHSKNILDKKRILDTISSILSDDIDIALSILKIIDVVLKMEGVVKYNIDNLFQIIIKLLFSKEDVKQLCYLSKIVFTRLSKLEEKTVNPIFRWILNESISYIMKVLKINQ